MRQSAKITPQMKKGKQKLLKILALLSALTGLVILFATLNPILNYRLFANQNGSSLLNPVVENSGGQEENRDFTQASNWFVGAKKEDFSAAQVSFYTISVPKLKIENASVALGGEDLSENLIHYPGTALPGKRGNAVVFGHSVLPIFFNPKDYMTIFSTLPKLKKGDDIMINYDGISFKYRVESTFEVLPTDLQVLDQDQTDSFLSLITCVPPGDPRKPKRLVVRARIIPLNNENTRR